VTFTLTAPEFATQQEQCVAIFKKQRAFPRAAKSGRHASAALERVSDNMTYNLLHVIFTFFLVKLSLLLGRGVLVLLVLRHKVIHVRLRLSKFRAPISY